MRLSLFVVIFLVIFIISDAQEAVLEDDNPVNFEENYDEQITTVNTETEQESFTTDITFAEEFNSEVNETLDESDATVLRHSSPRKNESEKKKSLDPDDCGDPPSIKNAIIYEGKEIRYEIGAKVTYACEFGYITDGSVHDSECILSDANQNLEWTDPEIRCSPRSCGNPGYVTHAHRVGSVFTFPNKVSFECDDGYTMRGYGTRYCQTSGFWSGNLPSCEPIFCDSPSNPEHGKVSFSSLGFDSELRYECESGFILKNDQGRVCSANGTWSGIEPTCQEAQCDQPLAPEHGTIEIIGDKSSVGSMALYTCNEGRVLVGSATSRCLDIGEWTFPTPKCLEPCFVPEVKHGKIGRYVGYRRKRFEELLPNFKIKDGEELFLRCEPNYEPFGTHLNEEKVTCNHGEWEAFPVCEPAMCRGPPPPTANAFVRRANRTHGGYVVYSCRQHSKKVKFGNVTCVFGTWNGVTPVCKDLRCSMNELSFPGLIKGKKEFYLPEQIFKVECERGFNQTKENNQLKCVDGVWKGYLPPCIAASCSVDDLIELENIVPGNEKMVLNGDFLKVKCQEGYSPSEKTARCSRGQWNLQGKLCKESSCTIYRIDNGGFSELVNKKDCGWFKCTSWQEYQRIRLGETKSPVSSVFVSCDGRYTFQGKQGNLVLTTCVKGKWYPNPVCLFPGTPYLGEKEVSFQKVEKSDVTSTKNPLILTTQIKPSDPITVLAPNENLKPTPYPSCACSYLNSDNKLVALVGKEQLSYGSRVKNNDKVKFHCRLFGYSRLKGVSEIKCENCRTWLSSEFPECANPKTGDTILQFDGYYTILAGGIIGVTEGSQLTVRCYSTGLQRVLPLWYASTGEELQFTSFTDSNGYYFSELNISNAACQHNKKYLCYMQGYRPSAFDFQVISLPSVNCSKFNENELDIHYHNKQTVNSTAMFLRCKDPLKKVDGPSNVTCLANGQWSSGPPTCKRSCPRITETEGLSISFTNGYWEGSIAAFHCLEPRIRLGVAWTTCKALDGKWADPPARCVSANCSLQQLFEDVPESEVPIMDGITSDSVPYNVSLRLSCSDNRILSGPDTATCGQDGRWQVAKVQCLSGCRLPKAENSNLIIDPDKIFYRFGESVSLSCDFGYVLNSEVVRLMCLGTSWSENVLPECKKE